MTLYRNNKSGETIESALTHVEAMAVLAEKAKEDSWLFYWVHKMAKDLSSEGRVAFGFGAINQMFQTAIENGLTPKRCKIRAVFAERKYVFSYPRSGSGNLVIKMATGYVNAAGRFDFGPEEYIGVILKDSGKPLPRRASPNFGQSAREFDQTDETFFRMLNAAPVRFLAACGKGMGWCSYCGRRLEDNRSLYQGYGETCSRRWGLPWGEVPADWEEATVEHGSVAANHKYSHLCIDPAKDWYDAVDYLVSADWQEEHSNMEASKTLRRYVLEHPYAWTRVGSVV